MVCAASHWPFGMLWIADRMISAAYPPTLSENAITAAGNGSILTPNWGRAKNTMNNWTSNGVPRITEM